MSILIVGVSHRSAPIGVLELLALDSDGAHKLLADVLGTEHVAEALLLRTCNRIEVYADVDRFHKSVEDISALLAEHTGLSRADLAAHLYVHYDEAAVAHAFTVAAGLDSMVVGESQILGQLKEALRGGQEAGAVGHSLNVLFQQSLRVGKRAHAETGIDLAGRSLVGVALDRVEPVLGGLAGRAALVVGTGSMAALAAATLRRRGVAELVIASRNSERARRLAAAVEARSSALHRLADDIAATDVVVSCTGATTRVVPASDVAEAMARRPSRSLAVVDLALPHDVAVEVGSLPGVVLVGLADLAETPAEQLASADVAAARAIVTDEVASFVSARRAARVAPTVVALRTMATEVVEAELARLHGRLPDLDPFVRAEIEQGVRRVAHKLLHAPTVRVKELAGQAPAESSYADALAELFALAPAVVEAVTEPEAFESAPASPAQEQR